MGYCIYKICCDNIDYVYVGSTQNFTNRKYLHKSKCNNENCKNHNIKLYTTIRDNGGWDNWRMVCIEELGDVSKRQAEIQEERWRVELQANLNSIKCYTTEEQMKEYQKEYYKEYQQQNKEQNKEQHKKYYEQNKDKIVEYKKQHYEQNRDKLLEYQKKYQQQNREKIAEYKKEYKQQNRDKVNEKIACECGCEIIKRTLARHKKSKKHQEWGKTIQG